MPSSVTSTTGATRRSRRLASEPAEEVEALPARAPRLPSTNARSSGSPPPAERKRGKKKARINTAEAFRRVMAEGFTYIQTLTREESHTVLADFATREQNHINLEARYQEHFHRLDDENTELLRVNEQHETRRAFEAAQYRLEQIERIHARNKAQEEQEAAEKEAAKTPKKGKATEEPPVTTTTTISTSSPAQPKEMEDAPPTPTIPTEKTSRTSTPWRSFVSGISGLVASPFTRKRKTEETEEETPTTNKRMRRTEEAPAPSNAVRANTPKVKRARRQLKPVPHANPDFSRHAGGENGPSVAPTQREHDHAPATTPHREVRAVTTVALAPPGEDKATPAPSRKRSAPMDNDETPKQQTPNSTRHRSQFLGPSTTNRRKPTDLSIISERTENSRIDDTPMSVPPTTPTRRNIADVRRARAARMSTPTAAPYAWERPTPQPRMPNADERLDKLQRMKKLREQLAALEKDEDIIEMQSHKRKKIKVDEYKGSLPARRATDSVGTFRVPDIDSDDEMEVPEDWPSETDNQTPPDNMFASAAAATAAKDAADAKNVAPKPAAAPAPLPAAAPATAPAPKPVAPIPEPVAAPAPAAPASAPAAAPLFAPTPPASSPEKVSPPASIAKVVYDWPALPQADPNNPDDAPSSDEVIAANLLIFDAGLLEYCKRTGQTYV